MPFIEEKELRKKIDELFTLIDELSKDNSNRDEFTNRSVPHVKEPDNIVKSELENESTMPFTAEIQERIDELFNLIKEAESDNYGIERFTYRSVPYLKELDNIVKSELEIEGHCDKKEVLWGTAKIIGYLADAYRILGRPSVVAQYYRQLFKLAATLFEIYGEKILVDSKEALDTALEASNCYIYDDCEDLRKLAMVFMSKDTVDAVFNKVMNDRGEILRDPVEMTEEYLSVIDEIEEKIDKNPRANECRGRMGYCHYYWALKSGYLREKGIIWRSPSELNRKVIFD